MLLIKNTVAIFFVVGVLSLAHAQVPAIQNIAPVSTHSNDTLVITGSGFGAAATMEVWFGTVKGTIVTSTEFSIEVKVPAQARLANVEVINLTSRFSAKSDLKFMPSLKTEPFSVSKFETPLSFTAQQELWDLCVCDLNTDGKPDIASTKFARPNSPYTSSQDLMVLQNTSSGPGNLSFNKLDKNNLTTLNLTFASDNIVCGDLNGDGKPELVVSRGSDPRNSIHILRNIGTGGAGSSIAFAAATTLLLDVNHAATRIAIRDLNKDGKPELIVTASTTDIFYIFVNQSSGGTLSFNTTPIKVDLDPGSTSHRTYEPEVQDFNGDGLPDIVVNRFQENNFFIFRNQSAGSISFAAPVVLTTPDDRDFNRISSADFNNDGKLDLVFTNSTVISQVSAIYLNQSSGSTIAFSSDDNAIKLTTSMGAWGIDVSDIDGDNDPDIFIAAKDVNELNVFLHNGNFAAPGFGARLNIPTTGTTNWNPRNIKVADLDGDAKPDIVYTGLNDATGNASVEILRNTHCHQPVIKNAEPLSICNGQAIVLKTAEANGVTYTWQKDGGATIGTSPYLTLSATGPSIAGTYKVTATSGACALSDEIVVNYNATVFASDPVITADTPLCAGSTLTLQTAAADTYEWTKPDGTKLTMQNPSFVATLDDAGIYSLQVTKSGCKSDVVTKRVDVASLANFSIASTPTSSMACAGNSVQLSVSHLANHSYQWKKDGANVAGTNATFSATAEGSYTVLVRNNTLSCEKETDPVSVAILQMPVADFSVKANACTHEQLTFTNQSVTDPRATPVYAWVFGDGINASVANPVKAYVTANTFNPTLTVSYSGVTGCSHNTSKTVTVTNSQQPVIGPATLTSLCPDEKATLSVSGTFATITWSNTTTAATTDITGPGTYKVNTTDANGCPGMDEIVIAAKPVPTVTATASDNTIPLGATTQLQADGADQYAWLPAETLDNPTSANPVATPTTTTTYTVTGTASNGCTGKADVIITIEGVQGFPVTFSPNGDGINEEWNIHAQDKPECTLAIFDGKGRRIFEGKGQNWDGTYQGKAVPGGTYYYVFGCPNEKPLTGNVLVIR